MALGFEESKAKYKTQIDTVNNLKRQLEKAGYTVDVQDDIQLGATFIIVLNGQKVATLEWNVPHYVVFESFVDQQEKSFAVDYVKNERDWGQFIDDIRTSLEGYAATQ